MPTPADNYLASLLAQAPTNSTLTSAFQHQTALGAPYMAVRATQAPFYDVSMGGLNPTVANWKNQYDTTISNFLFTPTTQMPSEQVMQ